MGLHFLVSVILVVDWDKRYMSTCHMYKQPLTDQISLFVVIYITETYSLWTVGGFVYF